MENIPLFTWFYTSQVVQDFFHQQYHDVQDTVPMFLCYPLYFLVVFRQTALENKQNSGKFQQ